MPDVENKIMDKKMAGKNMAVIRDIENKEFTFRKLTKDDRERLGEYFENLKQETKKRFGPHPLTKDYAEILCLKENDTADRYILLDESRKVAGYFILEYNMCVHTIKRYGEHNILLESNKDVLFAPSISDEYQNKKLSSKVMPYIIEDAKNKGARSIVLMGGTQENNYRAIVFYEKFGFKKYGGYQTEIYNHDMMLKL